MAGSLQCIKIPDRIENFPKAALEPSFGLEISIDMIFKMLIGGGAFYGGKPVYITIPSFCTNKANIYFESKIF
jgi:hypothetical protein